MVLIGVFFKKKVAINIFINLDSWVFDILVLYIVRLQYTKYLKLY